MAALDSFLVRAALGGAGVAVAAGPLGCFVVWRRMAYFSDATAHAAILGVALALALDAPIFAGVLLVALAMGAAIATLAGRGAATDTLLGVMAHSGLAAGLVAVSFLPDVRIDLISFLLGDILAVRAVDLALIWGGAAAVLGVLAWRWRALLTATLGSDLAHAAGIDPDRERMVLTLCLALVVAVAIKVVGVLLIGALLIVPAAAARRFARTPEWMAAGAVALGLVAALAGVWLSFRFDTPTGPSIVCVAAALFAAANLFGRPRA
ncbi:iron chelate uptake ABC transporter family permease subunit [uncultured Jannaschia sp.]|uniref:iron chelate uptake ABC transporter family permease subunit n=1 Tax=uncultured Jannaschia sp. TaxID=293347 RepID=UPI00262CAFB9|nr:iron chelate uptake ABC transporter family permease subunit [uncultured Jannaschia sp.]